jgi:hypothetical protein
MRGWGKRELAGRERTRGDSHYSRASEEERQTSEPFFRMGAASERRNNKCERGKKGERERSSSASDEPTARVNTLNQP